MPWGDVVNVRCITFDLDDTLWDCGPVLLRAERATYHWLAEHYPRVAARYAHEDLVSHRRRFFTRFPEMSHDLTWLRKRWLAHLAEEAGYDESLVEPGFRVFWENRNAVTLFEDAHDVLQGLRGRYRLGAITNGNADVHHIGIGHYFDFVVTAAQAGSAKPAAAIFHAALAAAGVAGSEALHIGDDPARDVLGAGAVGMRTVWFNPALTPWPGGRQPDAVVRRLRDLEAVLERLRDAT